MLRHLPFEREQKAKIIGLAGADELFDPIERVLAFVVREILACPEDGGADVRCIAAICAAGGADQCQGAFLQALSAEAPQQDCFADDIRLNRRRFVLPVEGFGDAFGGDAGATVEFNTQLCALLLGDKPRTGKR